MELKKRIFKNSGKFTILQINSKKDLEIGRVKWEGTDSKWSAAKPINGTKDQYIVDLSIYDVIQTGPVAAGNNDPLEYLFSRYNDIHPLDYIGNSLSVGDIVVLEEKSEVHDKEYYFCDFAGWTKVETFNQPREINAEERAIRINLRKMIYDHVPVEIRRVEYAKLQDMGVEPSEKQLKGE